MRYFINLAVGYVMISTAGDTRTFVITIFCSFPSISPINYSLHSRLVFSTWDIMLMMRSNSNIKIASSARKQEVIFININHWDVVGTLQFILSLISIKLWPTIENQLIYSGIFVLVKVKCIASVNKFFLCLFKNWRNWWYNAFNKVLHLIVFIVWYLNLSLFLILNYTGTVAIVEK